MGVSSFDTPSFLYLLPITECRTKIYRVMVAIFFILVMVIALGSLFNDYMEGASYGK